MHVCLICDSRSSFLNCELRKGLVRQTSTSKPRFLLIRVMANFMSITTDSEKSTITQGNFPCCLNKILSFSLMAITFCWWKSKLNHQVCSDYAAQVLLISSQKEPVKERWFCLDTFPLLWCLLSLHFHVWPHPSYPLLSPSLSPSEHNAKLQMHKILNFCLISDSCPISVVFWHLQLYPSQYV